MLTLKEYRNLILNKFTETFSSGEAEALTRIVLEDIAHYTPVDVAIRKDTEIPPSLVEKSVKVADRICAGEPVQYVIGFTSFSGGHIKVTPDVLIPRPETEELTDIIVSHWKNRQDLRVLDVCTGSGCIAVALASALPFSSVTATDISEKALDVARENAAAWRVRIRFVHDNALNTTLQPDEKFDIIVSNPPYICRSEAATMESNVLDHEPHLALFVPDDDPLQFYSPIARFAAANLAPKGMLYFEINPLYCDEICRMLRHTGFSDVESLPDIHGKKRFVTALQPDD